MIPRLFTFFGGDAGPWQILSTETISGHPIPDAERLVTVSGGEIPPENHVWTLRGMVSNERYVTRPEKEDLVARQQGLNRPEATRAALIPIRKNAAWWAMTQDERRAIFEEQSQHIRIGVAYLPAIARKLHHCRELSESEPFDFLTWFEFAPEHEPDFNRMLSELRATQEWRYVVREIDIRLAREDG